MATADKVEQKRLGQWIRAQRLRAKLTQKQLSEHLDISYQMVQKIENGEVGITVQRMNKIAGFLGVSASELMADFSSLMVGGAPITILADQRLSDAERRLLVAFNRIHDDVMKRKVMELLEQIAKK